MKKIITSLSLVLLLILNHAHISANTSLTYPKGFIEQKNSSISFLENKGQVHDQNNQPRPDVMFSGVNQDMVFHLRNNGVSYQLTKFDSAKKEGTSSPLKTINPIKKRFQDRYELSEQTSTIYRLDINWLNINTNSRIIKGKAYEGFNNYYTANCPNGLLNVKSFEDVTYTNIYNGIDLKWYQQNNQLKYDYMVSAGADYQQIQFEIEGALDISINAKGELEFKTPLGIIIEEAPLVTQDGKILPSSWKVNKNKVSFDIQNINPNQSFIIDPPVRNWGTYYGGSGIEIGTSCASDASGNVFLSGSTNSNSGTIIATTGSHQSAFALGLFDAFLVKFNSAGVRQWGTYYGGTLDDRGNFCCTDASGDVYLAGTTASAAGIGSGGFQNAFSGGPTDGFLVKFNSAGVRQWGTYYGDNSNTEGNSCATDAFGNVFLAGTTGLGTGLSTPGSHQPAIGGSADAYLVKFNSVGARLWATYCGDIGYDIGTSCATDLSGNVFLIGSASPFNTLNNIATPGAFQTIPSNGLDAFAVKFNSAGVRQWGTYIGAGNTDWIDDTWGYGCATDASGNIYICGDAIDFAGYNNLGFGTCYECTHSTGNTIAFLVKFDPLGLPLWGTYYGVSSFGSFGASCFTDVASNVYLTGRGFGPTLSTPAGHQTAAGGALDAYLVQFDQTGSRLWATYYGGTANDYGASGCVDNAGRIYLAGSSEGAAANVISTAGSHQSVDGGGGQTDAFLAQFYDATILPVELTEFNARLQNDKINLNWATQTEVNNNFFEVEKSVNGTNFEGIGKVKGKGNSRTLATYNFIDEEPVNGINYYRLKQVDDNGSSKNSSVVKVNFDKETTKIYPNPTNDYIVIQPKNNLQQVSIKNLFGVEVVRKVISSADYTIDLKALSEGFYIVNIDGKNQNLIIKK